LIIFYTHSTDNIAKHNAKLSWWKEVRAGNISLFQQLKVFLKRSAVCALEITIEGYIFLLFLVFC